MSRVINTIANSAERRVRASKRPPGYWGPRPQVDEEGRKLPAILRSSDGDLEKRTAQEYDAFSPDFYAWLVEFNPSLVRLAR